MQVTNLEDNYVQVALGFVEGAPDPLSLSMENPARLILDFAGIKNELPKDQINRLINLGVVKRTQAVEAQNKTRLIFELTDHTAYEMKKKDNTLFLTLTNPKSTKIAGKLNPNTPFHFPETIAPVASMASNQYVINNIDFKRGEKQEGRIIINLSDKKMPIDRFSHIYRRY